MRRRIWKKNFQELLQWSEQYRKIDTEKVKMRDMKIAPYLKEHNLVIARVLFRKSCFLLHSIRLNWKNHHRYKTEGYDCIDCLALDPPVRHPDHQETLLTSGCPGNIDLRQGKDIQCPRDQALFYISLIERRKQRYGS